MPVDVQRPAGPPVAVVVIGGQQGAPVREHGRVQPVQVDAAEHAAQHREGERPPGQRLQVVVGQQPGHQRGIQAERGGVPVHLGEGAHRVEHRVQRLGDHLGGQPLPPSRPAHPGGQHVRHRMLLGGRQQDLAGQPVEQEGGHLRRAHPQRPAEVMVTAVVDDVVRAAAGRPGVRQVLGLIRGEELGHQHGPAVPGPGVPPGRRAAPAGAVPGLPGPWPGPGDGAVASRRAGPGRRQRPDPGPDERVVGRERVAGCRALPGLGHRQGGLQQPPRLRRVHLAEGGPGRLAVRAGRRRGAALQQAVHLRGDPAVPEHPLGVVVDHHDQGVRLLAGVAEHADDLVAVPVGVRVHVAVTGGHGADVLGPRRPDHAAFHQGQRRRLRLHRLPRRAQARDAGQQRERGRAPLLGGVADQALADESPRRHLRCAASARPTRCRAARSP